jgi:hypothetical protein
LRNSFGAAAAIARRSVALANGMVLQSGDSVTISTEGAGSECRRWARVIVIHLFFLTAARRGRRCTIVGCDNAGDKLVADNIFVGEHHVTNSFDVLEQLHRFG